MTTQLTDSMYVVPPSPSPASITLSAEADHRIGNNLALIAALLRLQATDLTKRRESIGPDEIRDILTETAGRIEAVGRLHPLLADTAGARAIDVSRYVSDITGAIISSLGRPGSAIASFEAAERCLLRADQVLPIGLIVGEVVSNAIKYAHPTGIPTALSIRCSQQGGDTLIEIADDGVGLPDGFDPQTDGGLGFRLIRSLAAQIGAATRFDSNPLGLRFRLTLPA